MKTEHVVYIGGAALVVLAIATKGKIFNLVGTAGELVEGATEGIEIGIEAGTEFVEISATWLGEQIYINADGNAEAIAQMQAKGLTATNFITVIVAIENGAYSWIPQKYLDLVTYLRGAEIFMDIAGDLARSGGTRWAALQAWNVQQANILMAAHAEAQE